MTAVRTELKTRKQQGTETTADGLIKITIFKYIYFKISQDFERNGKKVLDGHLVKTEKDSRKTCQG